MGALPRRGGDGSVLVSPAQRGGARNAQRPPSPIRQHAQPGLGDACRVWRGGRHRVPGNSRHPGRTRASPASRRSDRRNRGGWVRLPDQRGRGGYFYFDIDDSFCFAKTEGQAATVEIEFFDSYPGSSLRLQYDGLGGPYLNHPDLIQPPDSGGWKTVRWNVSDGFFGNRQNEMSDFRIAIGAGNNAAIRRVSVFLPEENGGGLRCLVLPGSTWWSEFLEWPETADAVGWRLAETESLASTNWQDVAGPFSRTNGMLRY